MTARAEGLDIALSPDLEAAVDAALRRAVDERWVDRLWDKDPTLWSSDATVGERIVERLGWLHVPEAMLDEAEELQGFAAGVREQGFSQVVLCGMGGSSLAPDVLATTYGVGPNGLPVHVLDSTDPAAVDRIDRLCDPRTTLYLISTKSGTTIETLSFLAYFWKWIKGKTRWEQQHFAAISDPGKSLDAIPGSDSFRSVFLNPTDVGGRYSALTYVGLVPGALLDVDLPALLAGAVEMAQACREETGANPGLLLGVALGTLAKAGRDKLTFLSDPAVSAFGSWAEQLLAESTGKAGVGIVPVDREPPGAPERYGPDRAFVRLLAGSGAPWRTESDTLVAGLRALGHPVIDIEAAADRGLGAEFFRWEFATAVAGAVLGINPFDEPNVTESKDNTRRVLEGHHDGLLGGLRQHHAQVPALPVLAAEGPLAVSGDAAIREEAGLGTVTAALARHLGRIPQSGYLSIQAYVAPSPERDEAIGAIRALLRDRTGHATTFGYGPRFLHSTGQLHKGGSPIGWFLQLVSSHPADIEVPGVGYTFGTLIDAQAYGDFEALEAHRLPVLRVHLSADPDAGLQALHDALRAALGEA